MTEERFVELLQNAVEKVKTEEDPVELNNYRKLFKKNVPFALRMYVAAYLAKNASGGSRRESYRNSRESFRERNAAKGDAHFSRESRPEREAQTPRVTIEEDLASTVFISIGRNRRVFPRDLIGLIVQNAGIERTRIGNIRVLDNYSFVQLYTEDCDKVISALDGFEYRGRQLSVSFSRKKTDEDDARNAKESKPAYDENDIAAAEKAFAEEQSSLEAEKESSDTMLI